MNAVVTLNRPKAKPKAPAKKAVAKQLITDQRVSALAEVGKASENVPRWTAGIRAFNDAWANVVIAIEVLGIHAVGSGSAVDLGISRLVDTLDADFGRANDLDELTPSAVLDLSAHIGHVIAVVHSVNEVLNNNTVRAVVIVLEAAERILDEAESQWIQALAGSRNV